MGFLGLGPNYDHKFPDGNVGPDSVLSDGSYTCSMTSRGVCVCVCVWGGGGVGKHKLCTYGARGVAESPWAGTPSYAKITHLLGPIFVLARTRKKPKREAFNTPKA